MSIAHDLFCLYLTLTMLFESVLSVATGVGGCWWRISAKVVLVDVAFWLFQIVLPILLLWPIPVYFLLCCILHALVHFMGAFFVSVCWIFFLGVNIYLL